MAGRYVVCPSCGNIRVGAVVYRCKKCAHVFCGDCRIPPTFTKQGCCPNCGGEAGAWMFFTFNWIRLGRIERR